MIIEGAKQMRAQTTSATLGNELCQQTIDKGDMDKLTDRLTGAIKLLRNKLERIENRAEYFLKPEIPVPCNSVCGSEVEYNTSPIQKFLDVKCDEIEEMGRLAERIAERIVY